MIHDTKDVEGQISVTLDADDWIWLCELLSEILNQPDTDMFLHDDVTHALNALRAFELGI